MRDLLPSELFDHIHDHLLSGANSAESGWEAGEAEEDTLTGHLGAVLQVPWSAPTRLNGQSWQWRVRYKKFRGRGPDAFEKECGADGLIQIEIQKSNDPEFVFKGVLFQSKKGDIRPRRILTTQVERMERIAPRGSAVFGYDEPGYRGISGSEYLKRIAGKVKIPRDSNRKLGTVLADDFLECKIGLRGLYYDGHRKMLIVPESGVSRTIDLHLSHRISVDVRRDSL